MEPQEPVHFYYLPSQITPSVEQTNICSKSHQHTIYLALYLTGGYFTEIHVCSVFPEVVFSPTSPTGEIGQPLTVTCVVSGVSGLTSLALFRDGTPDHVCQIEGENVVVTQDGITCSGQTSTSNGNLQIMFSLLQCSDAGEYRCLPNLEASTPTTTQLSVFSMSVSFCVILFGPAPNILVLIT